MSDKQNNLVWIDLEMTGLDPENDRIIEIATVVTDSKLNVVAHGPELVINQPQSLLDGMDKWNTETHTSSGLVEAVQKSTINETEAQDRTLRFLHEHVAEGVSPICGNSVCQDRRFLYKYMPKLEKFFHYRLLDVSSVKIIAKMWAPHVIARKKKESNHRALEDVMESIEELRHYRETFLRIKE